MLLYPSPDGDAMRTGTPNGEQETTVDLRFARNGKYLAEHDITW